MANETEDQAMSDGIRGRSTGSLVDQMLASMPLAWLGCSAGVFMIISAVFWRFAMRPWRLVVRYDEQHAVWSSEAVHQLYRGPVPPDVPLSATAWMIGFVILGICICAVSSIRWREAARELRRRQRPDRAR